MIPTLSLGWLRSTEYESGDGPIPIGDPAAWPFVMGFAG